jgi:hypothetical protein
MIAAAAFDLKSLLHSTHSDSLHAQSGCAKHFICGKPSLLAQTALDFLCDAVSLNVVESVLLSVQVLLSRNSPDDTYTAAISSVE